MFGSYPSGSDLDALNDGDLVIVYSTGVQYRASVKDVGGSRTVSLIELLTSAATKADVDAKADRATTLAGYGITDAATKEELAAKADLVDGKVSSAVSTNNPAFVSAVRNTPTENMPEDMPTDWGTYGTVGAALAALAAGLKWIKNILGSVASGYSTFAEWIASKYTKPSGGIPASDLALTVQNSLDAADAAAPQATTYTKDETDAAIRVGASLGQMTNLGNGRYEYTGALEDASTQTYPREKA